MQKIIGILCSALLLAGCASRNPPAPMPVVSNPSTNKPVVTPDFRTVGKVISVNSDSRFVIISFSPGELPKPDARLSIYHNGLKVAEVKVDPQFQRDYNYNTVADIITGDVQPGDEARQD